MQHHVRQDAASPPRETVRAYGTMNTLRALECLAVEPYSAPELAARLEIGVRTARRILQRLEAEGYAVQEGGHRRRYRATLRLAVLGRQLVGRAVLPRVAARSVAALASTTGRTAHLWVRTPGGALCISHATPAQVAHGLPEPMLGELVSGADTAPVAALAYRGRSCHYTGDGETGIVAAAVIDRGAVVAALGVSGPRTVAVMDPVARAAEALGQRLADERTCGARARRRNGATPPTQTLHNRISTARFLGNRLPAPEGDG